MSVCADCGLVLEWYPPKNRWASKIATAADTDIWSFTCRVVRHRGVVVAADYHHVAGEPQERFRSPVMKAGYSDG